MTDISTNHRKVHYRSAYANGVNIFYREAGDALHPTLLLLHGFPTSSHMFRNLIPQLADRFHIVAPDLPGFGFSDAPDRAQFKYTFDHLTQVIEHFTETVGLRRYALRLRLRRAGRISSRFGSTGLHHGDHLAEWQRL